MSLVLQLTSLSENITEAISQNVRHKLIGEGQQRTEEQEGKDRTWAKQSNKMMLLFKYKCYIREIVICSPCIAMTKYKFSYKNIKMKPCLNQATQ